MYIFKILSEWSRFLFFITEGLWKGIRGLTIFPHTLGGTSYSFPVGQVNLEPKNFFDRGTIVHELSHQIMWQESKIGSLSIIGKVITGRLHLYHTENLLTKGLPGIIDGRSHALIEGWAEFIQAIFTGKKYNVDMLRDGDIKAPPTIPLGPPPANQGEFCEGAFANGLFDVYTNFIHGQQVLETTDGNANEPWMTQAGVRARWQSAIWAPLQELALKSLPDTPDTRDFLIKLKSMHPADWHTIAPLLHNSNMMLAPPTISAITPSSVPAGGGSVTIAGSEFATGETTIELDGVSVTSTVVDSGTLTTQIPAGTTGTVTVVVKTKAGSATSSVQRA